MKAKTKNNASDKIVLPKGTFLGGGVIYPISQLQEVFVAMLKGTPLPKPKFP